MQNIPQVLPLHGCCDAGQCYESCLVQPAVGHGRTYQAAQVISCTALQHRLQTAVVQMVQRQQEQSPALLN
jgi:hypothetical protein